MTLQDLGNLGELIGGLGVIASLLYLAFGWSRQREFHPEPFRSTVDAHLREIANEAPPELD